MHTSPHRVPARSRAQLIASGVSVQRGATAVLRDVDLTLTPSSRVAVVGENGRGKSTLLHVLAGTLAPDAGAVQRIGTIGVAEQEMDSTDERTVGSAVADAIAEPLAALAALDAAGRVLTDGTEAAAESYAAALEHAETLDAWDAERRVHGGGYAGYREGRRAELARWELEHERQQAERSRLQDSLTAAQDRLVSRWRPEKGTNKHGRATRAGSLVQSVHRRREALEAHAVTVPEPPQEFRFPELRVRTGASLLTVEGVGIAGRLPGPVSFSLSHRGRLVVTGPNGAGKSTLLAVTAGELAPHAGMVRRPVGTRVGFLRQESDLPPDRRAGEVYTEHVAALVSAGTLPSSEALGISQFGLLRPQELGKRVGELSMGQQRRLDLALVLAGRPHVLLLDEPTNHLSIALVDELTEALGATRAAVVMSTHDRRLLRDVAGWPSIDLAAAAGVTLAAMEDRVAREVAPESPRARG